FVPMEWLPKSVVGIAHALPAYWYIAGNEFLKTTETLQGKAMTSLFQNMFFLVLFGVLFLIINLFVLRLRQKRNG
ncbi:MAG: hypothetical protein HFI09_02635, partial [Bacilli bacterium]|nr:hypothetical protein [Bacilli bacterium]